MTETYSLVRTDADHLRLTRRTGETTTDIAILTIKRDELGREFGWQLKPLVTLHGSPRRVWKSAVEAVASTKIMKAAEAKTLVLRAGIKVFAR